MSLPATQLTRWQSHSNYKKKSVLKDLTCSWLMKNVYICWLKSKSKITSMCERNLKTDSTRDLWFLLLAITYKWKMALWVWPWNNVTVSQRNNPSSSTPQKPTQICAKNTFSFTFMELCTMNLSCRDQMWTKISVWHLQKKVQQKYSMKWCNRKWIFHYSNVPAHYSLA